MAIADDWTIDYSGKTITHTAGTTVYTVNELYTHLMDTFDELSQMDDAVPMSAQTPTEYTLINSWTIPDASFAFLKTGAVKTSDNNNLWANIYTLGTIEASTSIYVEQAGSKISSWWPAGHIDILVKVKSAGTEIAAGVVTVFARELSDAYDHYEIDLTAGGRNAVPLATSDDLNNQTASGTIAGYSDITITFGTASKTLGGVTKNYDVVVDCATRPLTEVYEYLKYVTREDSASTLNGVDGWRYRSANASYTEVKASPFGTFAGGKFFGARGVWIENFDSSDVKNYQLISADNTIVTPPNVVIVRVTGVVSGDRILVAALTGVGGTINKEQFHLASGNDLGDATVVVKETLTAAVPEAGYVRVGDTRYAYTSWTGSTFTLSGTLSASYAEDTHAYVPFIDEQTASTESNTTLTYSADIPVLVRVRKKGILPFEVESTISSTGLSVAAIRTTDSIVS